MFLNEQNGGIYEYLDGYTMLDYSDLDNPPNTNRSRPSAGLFHPQASDKYGRPMTISPELPTSVRIDGVS